MTESLKIVTLCTGNVSRSVMLGYMLSTLADASGLDWNVRTAGTHVIEGSSMSGRTRDALLSIEDLGEHHFGGHRSHQLDAHDVEWADVILTSEADHVNYVRRHFPDDSDKAVQLARFVRDAPLDENFELQVAAVALLGPSSEFDIADPAGGDELVYKECAELLWDLSQVFATIVSGSETT
jgi:protein-tyrosine-phosphatase